MWAAFLAIHKQGVPLPSHLIPSRPREAEAEASDDKDWRSQASPILDNTHISCGEWSLQCSLNAEEQRGTHAPSYFACGCCFGESRFLEIAPTESWLRSIHGGRHRIYSAAVRPTST